MLNVCRIRDCDMLLSKGDIYIISPPSRIREHPGRQSKKNVRDRGGRVTLGEQYWLDTLRCTYELTEAVIACRRTVGDQDRQPKHQPGNNGGAHEAHPRREAVGN